MSTTDISCWNCGELLPGVPLPVSRGEECPACYSAQRACCGCVFYHADAHNQCREPMADAQRDKETGNTCDYFRPRGAKTSGEGTSEAEEARKKLEAAFGADAIPHEEDGLSEAEAARRKLERLFGKKDE